MTVHERINQACYTFMVSPELAPLRQMWETAALRSALPPGPIDPMRLAMNQGDRERYLDIMRRAEMHRLAEAPKEKPDL